MAGSSLSTLLLAILSARSDSATVTTESGQLTGSSRQFQGLHRNGTFYSFQGVPYAEAPVGRLRWREPLPVTRWEGRLDVSGGLPAMGSFSK